MVPLDFALEAFYFWVLATDCGNDMWFWRTAALPPTSVHLPALAAIIASQDKGPDNLRGGRVLGKFFLRGLASHPLPISFQLHEYSFYCWLLRAWEEHYPAISYQPMVHLDASDFAFSGVFRPSLLPRWVADTARIMTREPYARPFRLGTLAFWRPARGAIIFQEDLDSWCKFWFNLFNPPRRLSRRPLISVIASKALFHCDKGPLDIIKTKLLEGPSLAHQLTCVAPSPYNFFGAVAPEPPLPLTPSAKEVMREVIGQWINTGFRVIKSSEDPKGKAADPKRKAACVKFICRQLAQWGEKGYLAACEIDLTDFVLFLVRSGWICWDLARIPATAFSADRIDQLLDVWRPQLTSRNWLNRATAWAAITRLCAASPPEPPDSYYAAVRRERRAPVLVVLSSLLPPNPDPGWVSVWARKSHPKARLALLRYALKFDSASAWRYLRDFELRSWRRDGTTSQLRRHLLDGFALEQIKNGLPPESGVPSSSNWLRKLLCELPPDSD